MSNHDNEDNQPSLSMSSTHATSDEAPPSYESVVFGGVSTDDSNINCGNYFRECDEIIPLSELDRRNGQCNPDSIRKNSFEPCLTTTNIRIDLTVTENSRRLPESARKSHDRREGRTEHVRFTRVSERESSRSSRSSRSRSQQESGDIERADVESDPESTSIAEDRQFSSNMCFSIIICLCCNPLCGLFAIACSCKLISTIIKLEH